MRRTMAVALLALAWTGDARAAAPQVDPAARPAITSVNGVSAYQGVHPADGDTFTVSRGTWSGVGNSYAYQWQRCGTTCADIPGATGPSLKADTLFGSQLRAAVTASNAGGSTTEYTPMTAPLVDQLPFLLDPARQPLIDGVPEEGSVLTVAPLALYGGSRPFSLAVTWQRCNEIGDCRDIVSTRGEYVPVPADVGSRIRAVFTVSNGVGHYTSGQLAGPVGPIRVNTRPPEVVTAPAVTATDGPVEGSELVASPGAWSGGRPIAHEFQWLRCDGDACEEIAGETASRHVAGADDVGRSLRVRVTAGSPYGSTAATSAASAVVGAAAPQVASAPSVAGTPRDGQILAGTRGAFTGTRPLVETAGWERCDAEGFGCVAIEGAAGDAYTLTADDIGRRLRFRVTASNAGGSAMGRSAASPVVQAIAPAASELPAVGGVARDEQELSGTVGTWTGSPSITYARQWMRCSDAGGCSPIAGATAATYAISSEDVGSRVRLRVTASNFGNAVEALSAPTAVVEPSAPRAVTAPALTGLFRDGEVLAATSGTWKGTGPLTRGYRWERCDGACEAIAGATESSYRLAAADVGQRVRVVVTATGPGGAAEAASVASDPVAPVAPAAATAPEVTGTARDGATLTATPGMWRGSAPLAVERRWERCDPACAAVSTSPQYTLTPADVGARIRVVERASNAGGQAEAASAPTAVVAARAPRSAGAPAIGGDTRDGETLEGARGTWEGTPELAFARQWLRCSDPEDAGGCEAIPGADGATRLLGGDDLGAFLRLRVTATNVAGTAAAISPAVGPVTAAAPSVAPGAGPTLSIPGDPDPSAPDVGDRVVVDHGRWAGTARDLAFAYRWERCDPSGCREIPGRAGQAETVTAEDAGRQLRVVVTATNAAGSASQATPRLGVTRAAPASPAAAAAPTAPVGALPAGSLLAQEQCQVVAARRTLRAGGVTLTVPAGTASNAQPLLARLTGRAKRITLKAGPRRVKVRRGRAALRPAVLAKAQLLQLAVVPRRGKPAKASARIAVKPCQALLNVRLKGRRLALRVDQRAPIGRVTFTLPKRLAIRPAATTTTGGELTVAGRRLTIRALPLRTSTATLTVRLAGRLRRGTALRFSATTDTARLKATASVRR